MDLRNAGLAVNGDNEPVSDKIPIYTTVSTVANPTIGRNTIADEYCLFDGVDQWRTSGSEFIYPTKSKTTDSSSILRISILEFFLLFYPCDYIILILTPHTNRHLAHGDMYFSEFLRSVGCWIYMDCFEGIVDRHMWWSNTEVKMFEEAPVRLTKYMSLNRFEDILRNLSYTDNNVPTYNDKFFHMRQMKDAWNENMIKVFEPSWVSVLDESMQE